MHPVPGPSRTQRVEIQAALCYTDCRKEGVYMELLCLVLGYVCGGFLTADVVAKHYAGKDSSQIGTGNPGMANIMANVSKKAGFLVLAGDILKTLLAFVLAWLAAGGTLGHDCLLWSGLGAVLGHNFPAWKKFKGGKGVTVTCTWLIIFMPLWGTLSCVLGGVITVLTGYLPLGAVLIPLFALPAAYLTEGPKAALFVLASLGIMLYKHHHGLARILHGQEERKFRKH